MKRLISLMLVMVFCVALFLPSFASGTEREEFIKLDKATYLSGEFMELIYEFTEADPNCWICMYKGTAQASNMVFATTATSRLASNVYVPIISVGMNGQDRTTPLSAGNYIMKVMYLPEGANHEDASVFVEGERSTITYAFTVNANSVLTPTISVAQKEISKNGNLVVNYAGVAHNLENRTLHVEILDQNGQVVKTRQLWNGLYYAGMTGDASISLVGVEPGQYTVRLACSDSEFVVDSTAIAIIVTDQEEGDHSVVFPEDLFKNKEICGQYFANADNPGNKYEVIDGEYVMTVPLHPGADYMYTWDPIPYETFTVTFDFLLHIEEGGQHADEMDFLFGLPKAGMPFHQVTMANAYGSFSMLHYKHTGTAFENYEFDTTFYDIYEEEMWYTISFQVTPDDVTVFIDDYEVATLEDTANCIGEYGHIGLRGGSNAGWKIKNLTVREGLYDGEVPPPSTAEPTVEATPTPTPEVTETPEETQAPTTPKDGNGTVWLVIGIVVAIVVVAGGAVGFILYKKKK